MRDQPVDQLRALFDRELAAVVADAADPTHTPPEGRLAALVHIASLIQSRDAALPKKRRRAPAVLLIVTMALVSLLLFARVRTTEIELEASLDELTFTLSSDQVLTASMELASLGMSGLHSVQLPASSGEPENLSHADGSTPAVSLASTTLGPRRGTVSLAPLAVASGSRVTLRGSEPRGQYRMSIAASNLKVEATLQGPVTVGTSESPSRSLDLKSPRPVLGVSSKGDVDLALGFAATSQTPLSRQLHVADLSLFRIDQTLATAPNLVRRVSTIRSGKLYLESLNGQERRLRDGEELTFANSRGEFRTVELSGGRVGLRFHGQVRGMTTGAGEGKRSIMPSWLEWMRARHGLSLFWASSLYLIGIAGVALRWWQKEL